MQTSFGFRTKSTASGPCSCGNINHVISEQAIHDLTERIAREYEPDRIILFGSHAYGTPRWDSDVDLLVDMHFEGNPLLKASEMIHRFNPPFAVDLLIRTPEVIRQRLEWNDSFLREAIERGKVLH